MNEKQLKLLCNGIASIADATDMPFFDVLEALTENFLDEEDASAVTRYMETL